MTSLRNCSCSPLSSGRPRNTPVILPPGCARFRTNPSATGSLSRSTATIGIPLVACLAADSAPAPLAKRTSTSSRTIGRELGQPLGPAIGISEFDYDVPSLGVPALAESLFECLRERCIRRSQSEIGDPGHACRRLRFARSRTRQEAHGEGADELPSVDHWIT